MMTDKDLEKVCQAVEKELQSYDLKLIDQTVVLQALITRRYSEVAMIHLGHEINPKRSIE